MLYWKGKRLEEPYPQNRGHRSKVGGRALQSGADGRKPLPLLHLSLHVWSECIVTFNPPHLDSRDASQLCPVLPCGTAFLGRGVLTTTRSATRMRPSCIPMCVLHGQACGPIPQVIVLWIGTPAVACFVGQSAHVA